MTSEIKREDVGVVAVTIRGEVGVTTPRAEVLRVGEDELDSKPLVEFATETVTLTMSDEDLAELAALIADINDDQCIGPGDGPAPDATVRQRDADGDGIGSVCDDNDDIANASPRFAKALFDVDALWDGGSSTIVASELAKSPGGTRTPVDLVSEKLLQGLVTRLCR